MDSIVCFCNFFKSMSISLYLRIVEMLSVVLHEKQTCLVHFQASRMGLAPAESGWGVFDSGLLTCEEALSSIICSQLKGSLEICTHCRPPAA